MQTEVLGERYKLEDRIGHGGMATIYRGQDLRMERVVAIKVLREVYSTDPKFVTRFQREAKAASSLQHPNIVQVYDYGQTDGNYFIVMELVEGTDLRRYLRSRGMLAIDRAIIIAHDVALGLGAAHRRGIVHRDVKPQNVLVGRDGTIKLTDFGIASVYKDINAERLTTTGMTLGTVQYYAPEQAQGEIVSPAADVYALGIVMYEMLTGRTPFDGDTPVAVAMQHIQDLPIPPSQYNPNIPPALEEIILRCLEKVPEMRYRDGSTLAHALELLGDSGTDDGISGPTVASLTQAPTVVQNYTQHAGSGIPGTPRPSTSSPNHILGAPPPYSNPNNNIQSEPDPLVLAGQSAPPYNNNAIEDAPTRQYQRGTMPRSAVPDKQRDSRFASVVTVVILLATLLLLGFSIYLAAELHFISIPGICCSNPTPTAQNVQVQVPDLRHLDYQAARNKATAAGFTLKVPDGNTAGIVISQNPTPPAYAAKGSPILVQFGSETKTVIVPPNLVNNTLSGAEQILTNAGISYDIHPVGTDPTKGPNTVTKVDPSSGSTIPASQPVILDVANYSTSVPTAVPTSIATPLPTPISTPTPTPTPGVTPTPTPTPGVTPTPTPTSGVTPTPTSTPGVTPTPTKTH